MPNPALITAALNSHRCDTVEELINVLRGTNNDKIAKNYHLLSICYHHQKYLVLALKYAKLAVQVASHNSSYWLHYLKVSFSLQCEAVSKSIYDQILRTELINQKLLTETYGAHKFIPDNENLLLDRDRLSKLTKLFNDQNYQNALIAAENFQTLFPDDANLKNIIAAIHLKEGRYVFAEKFASDAVNNNKVLSSGYNNLGLATRSLGRFVSALNAFEASCFLEPKNVTHLTNWANTLEIANDFRSAAQIYEQIIELDSSKEFFLRAAICHDKSGSHVEESSVLKKAKLKYASDYEIQNRLGVSLLKLHKVESAIDELQIAVDLNERDINCLNNLGVALMNAGKFEESISVLIRATKIDSSFAPAHNNLGNSYKQIKDYENAIRCLLLAAQLDKSFFDPHFNLGLTYQCTHDFENSVKSFEHALTICPDRHDVFYDMGNSYLKLNDTDTAVACYNKCLSKNTQHWKAWNSLGNAHSDSGNFKAAIDCYEATLAIKSNEMSTHRHLSLLKKYEKLDHQVLFLLDAVENSKLNFGDSAHAHFALAKAFEDLNQITRAYEHFTKGNEARRKELNYSFSIERPYFKNLTVAAAELNRMKCVKDIPRSTLTPIFVVGLPRSGTTLVERIISSHSEIISLGELNDVRTLVENMVRGVQPISYKNLFSFGAQYLHRVSSRVQGYQYFIDKMPHNFLFIPFIQKVMPNSRIIVVKRDKRATCWSNFRQYFTGGALGYSCRISDIIDYHSMYTDLLKTFSELGYRWIDMDYEVLTAKPEKTIQTLISQLDLAWQDVCLRPDLNTSSVQTASQLQVRNKIYTGSSHNWRKYERHLPANFSY